jgi:hypothetical protein
MKLEDQVTNLKLSKKLKELRVKQESLFYWYSNPYAYGEKSRWNLFYGKQEPLGIENETSAFTATELGVLLPKSIKAKDGVFWLQIEVQGVQDGWACQYRNIATKFGFVLKFFEDKSMVNAMAKMLIYLIENKLINP